MSLGEDALADALRPHLALQVRSGWLCACGWGRGEGRTAREWQDHSVAAALAALPSYVAVLDVATLALDWHDALWRYHQMAPQTFGGDGCECVANARLVVAAARKRRATANGGRLAHAVANLPSGSGRSPAAPGHDRS
ncbi:MAG: hypothetical protein M3301_08920 [Chloroflexota bacterium]|nr:hypothetical protein [Chloroflexota bacterium]